MALVILPGAEAGDTAENHEGEKADDSEHDRNISNRRATRPRRSVRPPWWTH